jgi:hypothetical protein
MRWKGDAMLYRQGVIGWVLLAMIVAWPLSLAGADTELQKSQTAIAQIEVAPTRIDWLPQVDYERMVLTVTGPGDLFLRRQFEAGKAPSLSLFDSDGDRLPDGSYAWELRAVPRTETDTREQPTKPRGTGGEAIFSKLREGELVLSGHIAVKGGSFVAPAAGVESPQPPLPDITAKDSTLTGKLVNDGNACIGDECNSLSDANFSALTLKSSEPNLLFDDVVIPCEGCPTSPRHDWAVLINPSDTDQFSITDIVNSTTRSTPFTLRGGAPDNSLFVDGSGNLGVGTSTPAVRLDVKVNASGAGAGRIQNSSATGYPGWEYLGETGAAIAYAGLVNSSKRFQISTIVGNYPIVLFTNGREHLRIDPDGDVGINCDNPTSDLVIASEFGCNSPSSSINAGSTSFTASSSRTIKEKLSPIKIPDILEKMAGVEVYTYDFIGGPKERIGLMAEDFHQIFQRGSEKMLDGQEVEMALWLAVQELAAQNKELRVQNQEIGKRLAELEARLVAERVVTP